MLDSLRLRLWCCLGQIQHVVSSSVCETYIFIDHSSFGIRTFEPRHQSGLEFLCNQLGLFILFYTNVMGLTLLFNNIRLVDVLCLPKLLGMIVFFSPQPNEKAKKIH